MKKIHLGIIGIVLLLLFQTSLTYAAEEHTHSSMQPHESAINWISVLFLFSLLLGLILFLKRFKDKDLLEYPLLKKTFKSRWYPFILQAPTVLFFLFIVYFFFFGSTAYSQNPGSILAWTLWWPLVPITFILFGRLWCAICPFPILGDFIQKFIQPTRKPGQFLLKYGIWITDGIFIAITLFDRLYGMVDNPVLSGVVFLLILFGIIIFSIRYERRTFCKHICFLGGVSGNYSMLSGLSIETKNKETCLHCKAKACYFGSGKIAGCPYSNVIPSKTSMRNCTLCANCIKACPHDNISLKVRNIASELWNHTNVSFSESFFAKLMVGVVIIQNLGMLALWSHLTEMFTSLGIPEKLSIALLYFIAIATPLLLMTLTSFLSNKLQTEQTGTLSNFAAFGYAFIPIDVAGHLAHNLFHLLAEGKSILGAFIGLFTGTVAFEGALTSSSSIQQLQFALIGIGSIGTLYVAYKIARAKEQTAKAALKIVLPHLILLFIIIAVNFFLFITPMNHRGG